jgi:LDH2 family malate/lactate/ureidoglycolate dehydrogenase
VREQVVAVLGAWGMARDLVETTADVMIETDLWGVDSHGVSMLMMYEQMKDEGRLKVGARARLVEQTPVTARIDGDAGLGHPVAHMGVSLAAGVGVVTAFNSHHIGITSAPPGSTRRWPRTAGASVW